MGPGRSTWKLVWYLARADPSVRPLGRFLDEHIVLALVLQAQLFLRNETCAYIAVSG